MRMIRTQRPDHFAMSIAGVVGSRTLSPSDLATSADHTLKPLGGAPRLSDMAV